MSKHTLHDRFVAALQSRGETIVTNARSTKYTVLTRTHRDTGERIGFYFVGRAGALRIGNSVADSKPIRASARDLLLRTTAN